ncbi:hypothetical protein G9A89_010618 [Geosiphon pyriformis]|nr:hypothetical protein G9A89_010618 [Geosiphon pyriformis]
MCGVQSLTQASCINGGCCSQYGYCGTTLPWCGPGCQKKFGLCNDSKSLAGSNMIIPLETTIVRSKKGVGKIVKVKPNRRKKPSKTKFPNGLAPVIITCSEPKTIAMSFDDGPADGTAGLLDILKEKGIKATFFVNGANRVCIYDYISTIKRIVDEGHQLAHHTWNHPSLPTLSDDKIEEQMTKLDEALRRIVGLVPSYMRPPYADGIDDDRVRGVIGRLGYQMIKWNIDPGDATDNADNLEAQKATFLNQTSESPFPETHIVINHDSSLTTTTQLAPFEIDSFAAAGYTFKTVGECLGDKKGWYKERVQPQTYDPETWVCDN